MSDPGPATTPPTDVPPRPSRRRSVIVVVVVVALVVAAFVGWRLLRDDEPAEPAVSPTPTDAATTPPPTQAPPSPDLEEYYAQELTWRDCGRAKCTQLQVPLDYAEPGGQSIKLSVLKVPATDSDARIGSLVVNPGGPGGSGVDYAAAGSLQFGATLSRVYDIVGFDPRGVGASTPIACADTAELDELLAFDPDPDTDAEAAEAEDLLRDFGAGCVTKSGNLVRHVSTVEAARDMDVLRAALGEDKLDYLGASYGTFLGATYADIFPDKVGRMVLDGALDPRLSSLEMSRTQARGFETALRAYVAYCVDQGGCPLGDELESAVKRVRTFLDELDRHPLPTSGSRELTEGYATLGIWMPLYARSFWPQLTSALRGALEQGDGSGLLGLADLYTSRGSDGFTDNSTEALYAVNCLDDYDSYTVDDVEAQVPAFEKASPTFGRIFAWGLTACSDWPVHPTGEERVLDAPGAPPIVVTGTTRDPATPVEWAEALADELESGRLIIRDGDGHTAFQRGNECVDEAIETWLVDGKAPKGGLRC